MLQKVPKIRIAHLSDIHIKDVRRDEYAEVFKLLYQKLESVGPGVIVLCGDIFHDKTKASAYNFSDVENFLSSLVRIAPVILIPGNHDMNVKVAGSPDLLSPVFKNHSILKEPRFIYWRNSGVYAAHGVSWIVIAPDQEKPSREEIEDFTLKNQTPRAARICLLHETVNGSLLFNGNLLRSKKISVEDLAGYDAVLAGDIHLRQSIGKNGRAMYAGSLVQQNLGESYQNHGFLLWEIELSDVHSPYRTTSPLITPFDIYNKKGFLKVSIRRGIDKTELAKPSEPNYYEVTYDEETSREHLTEYVQKYSLLYGFPPRAVRLVKSSPGIKKHTFSSVQEVYNDAQSLVVHEEIITEILGANHHLLRDILDIHRHHYKQMSAQERGRVRIRLLQLEFSNLYCYGSNNFIDFTKMEGKISGIIASNQTGKSSLLDILLFVLYEEYPRADRKVNIINDKATEYYVKLCFEVDGKVGCIEKSGKKGKQLQSSNCRLFYGKENFTRGTSTLTCKEIEKLVGTYANAEFTSFLQQDSGTDFVHLLSGERKKILAKLLSFAFFEDLEKKIRDSQGNLNIEFRVLEKSFGGIPIEQLEKDYEDLTIQSIEKKKKLKEVMKRLSDKKNLLEDCFSVKEKITLKLSGISERITLLGSFEEISSGDVNMRLGELQSITEEKNLSYDEYREYDVKIPVGFLPNFKLSKVPSKDDLRIMLAELETRRSEKENLISSDLESLKKLELKRERLSVLLENLTSELVSNSEYVHFDSVQFTVKEPITFFSREEGIPWNSSKLGPPVTRKQIDWATACLSTPKTGKSELFVEVIQKISVLSSIDKPLANEGEGEYQRLSRKVGTCSRIVLQEAELLSQLASARKFHSETLSEVSLWRSILAENAEPLPESSILGLDLSQLKGIFNDLVASEALAGKLRGFLGKFTFDGEFCRSCRQNQVILNQAVGPQQLSIKEDLAKQIFSFLFYRLSSEKLLVTKLEEKIFNIAVAKGDLERFEELQLQQKAILNYNKLMEEKACWEEKRRAIEILEVAAHWWLEDKKVWDSYFFISSKLPTLRNLREDLDLLDRELVNTHESLRKVLDGFEKFSTSTEEMLLVRKYWLGEIFKCRELLEKAEAYDSSIRETADLKNKLSESENSLTSQLSQIGTYQKEIELIQSERAELIGALSVTENQLLQKKHEIIEERKRSKQLSSKQRELELVSTYRKIIDPKTGLADRLLKRSASYLQNEVNSVLSECGASFLICFTEDFEVKTLVGTGKQLSAIPSRLSSGYQKFVLSLAFRSALWRLSEVTLPDCQFIDEGFGSCDEENLELIIQYISSAVTSSLSPRIFFIISHIDTMKNAIQEPLAIEVKNLQSCIRM